MGLPEYSTACPDWADRIMAGESIIPPPIFPEEADRAWDIFSNLKVADMPGMPTFGEVSPPWIRELVRYIFGAYDAHTGRQLIREIFVLVPKKSSKSTAAAGIMLTALLSSFRNGGLMTICAPTKEVALNSFQPAAAMAANDDYLAGTVKTQQHLKQITDKPTGNQLRVIAADVNAVSGSKASHVLIDELWLFGPMANGEDIIREACGGLASRPEGFTIYLSTQSNEPPAGIFRKKLQYARDVRDGIIEDKAFCPIIFELPEDKRADHYAITPELLALVNPSLGYSVDREYLAREHTKAINEGTAEALAGFLSKYGNVEVGLALRSDRWRGADYWLQQESDHTLDDILAQCEVVTLGIDGGGLDDLLGVAVVGRTASGEWLSWAHCLADLGVLQRRKIIAQQLRDYEQDGDLTLVNEIGKDISGLIEIVKKVKDSGLLYKIGIDPAGIGIILEALENEVGLTQEEDIVGISQGWKLGAAITLTERRLAEGVLKPAISPMMRWNASNARVEPRGNAILITKQASGRGKIDALMALFSAVQLMGTNPETARKKYQVTFI